MARPTAFTRQTSFTQFSSNFPSKQQNGASLDAEFNAAKVALDETQSNLALIQDDDGHLARGSVGRGQLDSSITIGFDSPTPWAADTSYTADTSTVWYTGKFYTALETHTSGATFDTTKWNEIADLSASAAIEDGSITEAKLASGAVTADKIQALAVTTPKIASGAVTGAKIAASAVSTTHLADNAVTSAKVDSSVWSTGDVKLTLKTSADTGWLLMDDGTIGNASSGASSRANADCEDLFTLLFDNISDASAPILTSAGAATTRAAQTDAATAWAAGCRMSLTKVLGRALAVAGSGSGLTARDLGSTTGAETVTLAQANLPNVNLPASGLSVSQSITNGDAVHRGSSATGQFQSQIGGTTVYTATDIAVSNLSGASAAVSGTIPLGGSGTAVNKMPPETFLNVMVKL